MVNAVTTPGAYFSVCDRKRINQRGLTYRHGGVSGLLLLLSFLLLLYLLLAEQRIIKTLVGKDAGNGSVQAPFQRIIITALVLSEL